MWMRAYSHTRMTIKDMTQNEYKESKKRIEIHRNERRMKNQNQFIYGDWIAKRLWYLL